jgi:outer membrane protein OmpA-like peptidoglycan-associated protein
MRTRVVLAVGALAVLVPVLAGAQQPRPMPRPAGTSLPRPIGVADRSGSVELSLGAAGLSVDQAFNAYLVGRGIADASPSRFLFGGVGRLGYNFSRSLGISAGAGLGFGNGTTLLTPFAALTYTVDLDANFSPFLEVGADMPRFSRSGNNASAQYGLFGGLGFRSFLSSSVALRVEARMAYDKFKKADFPNATYNGTGSIGLSYFFGGGPPRDSDGDGVSDRRDQCPATPRGARVLPAGEARAGCPIDTDADGIWDGLDQCANTPPNARPVYPLGTPRAGCPQDSDADGVADYLDRCPNTPANARPIDATGCPVDSDHDAVADYLDRCPNTPANAPVDATGCPRDSDADGVADHLDRCPNTPANARPVDATGCPVDTDHDAVADYLDRCPNTAAGTQVDANGCPVQRDADRDGVIDANDRCPGTPPNTRVDENGCPYHELPAAGATLVLQDIRFAAARADLLPASNGELDRIAAAILSIPNSRWEVAGYTDNRGMAAANLRLSRARAEAVKAYLVSKGVPAASLTAVGYGAQHPVAPNTTAANRARNRRVEIKRLQ